MSIWRIAGPAILALLVSGPLWAAEKLALIIANRDYRPYNDALDAFDATRVGSDLQAAGFEVRTVRNLNSGAIEKVARGIRLELSEADQVIVFLAGHVVSTGRESYLLTTDAHRLDALAVGRFGLPVGVLTDLLGDKSGSAVLMVAGGQNPGGIGPGVTYGYVPSDIPQGVSVYSGGTGDLVAVLRQLLVPGTSTGAAAASAPVGVDAFGFVSHRVPFIPATAPTDTPEQAAGLEDLLWQNAVSGADVKAVQAYLDRFPQGVHADRARELLDQLEKTPEDIARETEAALRLGRDGRRELQRNLSLLGYDPRGIDGIFGPGTRKAVRAWQRDSGFDETGYLDRDQVASLQAAAEVRARELEEQARIRREEEERRDAAFWRDVAGNGGEDGLRAYLKRYPDGLYADIARDRLQVYDEERRRTAEIAEGNAWDRAVQADTVAGYRDFLKDYPDGVFAPSARARLDALRALDDNGAEIAAARAEERKILSNPITRLLVERQLTGLGLKPGKIDGKFDDDTRKAIRRFQRAAQLPVTGYMTQATIVRLLAAK